MKKNIFPFTIFLLINLCFQACDDEAVVDSFEQKAPSITSISPTSGNIDSEITIKGNNLQAVDTARIGGIDVPIKHLISDTLILIIADKQAFGGKIELIDRFGRSAISDAAFVYLDRIPKVTHSPTEIDSGTELVIEGSSLNSVLDVEINNTSIEIISQAYSQLVVKLPLTIEGETSVKLKYMDSEGNNQEVTLPPIIIGRLFPVVHSISHQNVVIGDEITLIGSSLNLVDSVTMDGIKLQIISSAIDGKEVKFRINDNASFSDGKNTYTLSMHSGETSTIISKQFSLTVLPFYSFKNKNLSSNSKGASNYFLNLETGNVVNADNFEETDRISALYNGDVCSEANVLKITESEYNSVDPYIMMLKQSSSTNIYGPASGHWLSRYIAGIREDFTGGYRIFPSAPAYGTPIIFFRVLNEIDAYEKTVIDKIKSGNLDEISTLFNEQLLSQIDLTKNGSETSDGWSNRPSSTSMSYIEQSANRSRTWAQSSGEISNNIIIDPGTVVLCLYYSHIGYNSSNPHSNIKKFGFIDIYRYVQDNTEGVLNGDNGAKNNIDTNVYWKRLPM